MYYHTYSFFMFLHCSLLSGRERLVGFSFLPHFHILILNLLYSYYCKKYILKSNQSFINPESRFDNFIIGECNRDNDLAVNVVKGKQLTNTRAAGSDHTVVLKRPRPITLEYALDYINSDELVEVTPHFLRLRKKILNTEERKKFDAKKTK